MERRLAEIPAEEWNNLAVDLTPKDQVLDYLMGAFPTQPWTRSRTRTARSSRGPSMQDGRRCQCQEALRLRDRLIEHLACLPAVPARWTRP